MKNKAKTLALVEIAVVLCSVFLVALPVVAADQNQEMPKVSASVIATASEDDYVLGVYGNANEDDTIDMGDVVYTKLAIFGKKPKTELCDAKYDGRINVLDVIQTKLIILGKEKELTVVDSADRIVTVKKPIKRIIITFPSQLETLRSLKVPKDTIVGITQERYDRPFFPEFSDVPSVGWRWTPDIEAILDLNPDVVFYSVSSRANVDTTRKKLESVGLTVLCISCCKEVKKLGYIFDKKNEAEELLDWREKILNSIEEKVEKIPEEDKPKVFFETSFGASGYSSHASSEIFVTSAGGRDIFAGRTASKVDPEAVVNRNPDIIVRVAPWADGGYDVDVGDTTELEEVREEIMSRPELRKVKAVEDRKVYIVTDHLVTFYPVNGCRYFVLIAYQAKWFHPELFADLDPKALHQEYLTRFQGLDVDLDEKGVFVYHPEEHPDGN